MRQISFKQRLDDLGYKTYQEYLRQPHWRNFSRLYRESVKPKGCYICGSGEYHLHHTTYERLGREEFGDVVPLCTGHHKYVHSLIKQKKAKLCDAHCVAKSKIKSIEKQSSKKKKKRLTKKDRKRAFARKCGWRRAYEAEAEYEQVMKKCLGADLYLEKEDRPKRTHTRSLAFVFTGYNNQNKVVEYLPHAGCCVSFIDNKTTKHDKVWSLLEAFEVAVSLIAEK